MSSSSAYHPGPVEPTPQQRLLLMDDVQWESFIEPPRTPAREGGPIRAGSEARRRK